MFLLVVVCLGVLGLVIGSFIGAVTWRLPRSVSISKGRSVCDHCKKKIAWWDNIPVLSYILLGGKCRHCHTEISPRYPFIELSTMVGFVFTWLFFEQIKGNIQFLNTGPRLFILLYLISVFSVLVAIFVVDLEHRIIFDSFIFTLILATLIMFLVLDYKDLYMNIFSGFMAALILLLIHIFTKGKGMGLGDVKFALFGGLFLGFPNFLTWLFLSFVSGALVGIFLILFKKVSFGKHIAFGPFLCTSLILVAIFGKFIDRMFF